MAVAYNTYWLTLARAHTVIDAAMVFDAYEATIHALAPQYQAMWADIHRIRGADRVMKACDDDVSPASTIPTPIMTRTLHALAEASVPYQRRGHNAFTLVDPMFGEWIRRRT